jgi:hypothetical protein
LVPNGTIFLPGEVGNLPAPLATAQSWALLMLFFMTGSFRCG